MNNSQISKLLSSRNIGFALVAWLALEILVFIFVAHSIGLLLALLLAVATSAIGLSDIRGLLDYLRRRAARSWDFGIFGVQQDKQSLPTDGALQALASVLLILPGFASDFVGLALKSPSVRANVARRLEEQQRDPRTIDLAPGEWKYEKPKRSPRKKSTRK